MNKMSKDILKRILDAHNTDPMQDLMRQLISENLTEEQLCSILKSKDFENVDIFIKSRVHNAYRDVTR